MDKTDVKELELCIIMAVEQSRSVEDLRDILVGFKKTGGVRNDAYKVLNRLRSYWHDEKKEDLIMDLMDFVSGFCVENDRIWP